ncbi:MAG: hypothetical protein FK734_05755 [Asgard group archaeon]|nr:hypothetical protein [Asgard group archaeon]
MPLGKKKDDKKKKSIPKDKIMKMVKDVEFLDLGEPYGENARRYLTFQLSKFIDNNELTGTVITPDGVYISLNSSEVKDVIRLIKAKGICNLEDVAKENKWNIEAVKLIAKNRINLIERKDNKVITRESALDLLYDKLMQGIESDIYEIADELELKRSVTVELLKSLIADNKIEGYYIKSSHKFLPREMLEESIKELIEEYELDNKKEVKFSEIAEEYDISDEAVYNILLKLYNSGDIEVQLNLGKKICLLKENIEDIKWEERIPEEERKLDIEDLTKKS